MRCGEFCGGGDAASFHPARGQGDRPDSEAGKIGEGGQAGGGVPHGAVCGRCGCGGVAVQPGKSGGVVTGGAGVSVLVLWVGGRDEVDVERQLVGVVLAGGSVE